MKKNSIIISSIIFLLSSQILKAQPGQIDLTYGKSGIATYGLSQWPENNSYSDVIALQQDGKIIVGGRYQVNGDFYSAVARFNANGSLDNSFNAKETGYKGVKTLIYGTDTIVNFTALKLDAQERIVLVGLAYINNKNNYFIARIKSNGEIDETFGNNGSVIVTFSPGSDQPNSIAIDPAGRILVSGIVNNGSTNSNYGILM